MNKATSTNTEDGLPSLISNGMCCLPSVNWLVNMNYSSVIKLIENEKCVSLLPVKIELRTEGNLLAHFYAVCLIKRVVKKVDKR